MRSGARDRIGGPVEQNRSQEQDALKVIFGAEGQKFPDESL